MISITKLVSTLNEALNSISEEVNFLIIPDGREYTPPTRTYNEITTYINGVAKITDSALVPINNLTVITQTLTVNVIVPIDTSRPDEESFEPVRKAIGNYLSKPHKFAMGDENDVMYSVSLFGSQPTAGDIMLRDNVGKSIMYAFNVFYSFIESGISSLDFNMTFDGEAVPFIELSVIQTPVTDGGAFLGTDGSAENYATSFALEIQISVPALADNKLTHEFAKYLLTKQRSIYPVTIAYAGISGTFNMMFTTSNITVRGVENIGQAISLIEAVESENA